MLERNYNKKYKELFNFEVLNIKKKKSSTKFNKLELFMGGIGLDDFYKKCEIELNDGDDIIASMPMLIIPVTHCNSIQKCLDADTEKEEISYISQRCIIPCVDLKNIKNNLTIIIDRISTQLVLDLNDPKFGNIYKDNKELYDLKSPITTLEIKDKMRGIIVHKNIPGDTDDTKINNLVLYFIDNLLKIDTSNNIEEPDNLIYLNILNRYLSLIKLLPDKIPDKVELSVNKGDTSINISFFETFEKYTPGAITSPKYLIISLSRFNFIGDESIKLDKRITFNQHINLPSVTIKNEKKNPVKYKIRGIGIHAGSTVKSGHYYAYCIHNEKWFEYNDTNVDSRKLSEIKDNIEENGYLFIYEKIEK